MTESDKIVTLAQLTSKAGKARAAKLSPESRKEIASLAGSSRKNIKCHLPRATHIGELIIGEQSISCAVLQDGTRVITQASLLSILGRTRPGGMRGRKPKAVQEFEKKQGGDQLPSFMAISNLIPFISNDLRVASVPIKFHHPKLGKIKGYDATIIPLICDLYLAGRKEKVLTSVQLPIANRSEIIVRTLSKIAIITLVDEATSYQEVRDRSELQNLLNKYISRELQPWTKKFPNFFFDNIKRIYGHENPKGTPQYAGKFINKYIYNEISPEVLQELKDKNPVQEETGRRKHCHHQFLTTDIGHPTLEKQVLKINTILSIADSKDEFDKLFEKTKRD